MNSQIANQESMLRESIKHFLTSYQAGNSDFSSFESIFFRLIQTMLDPPLEITWFYSAVTYHAAKPGPLSNNPSVKVIVAKDLLNLLISCSNLSCTSKKIALLAPVVYELYNIVYDCKIKSVYVGMEVENLVDNVIGCILKCAELYDCGTGTVEFDNLLVCFEDLVRVWTADRGGGSYNFGENSRVFFPFLTDGVRNGISAKSGVRELSGMVLCEVLFLRVYLSFGSGMYTEELLKDAAVQTIKGFWNYLFLEILLKTLLEPNLPIAALLSYDEKVAVRIALYDAIMVECSFYSRSCIQSTDSQTKRLALLWVLVADSAIQFAGAKADQARAISYLKAFHESEFVTSLINWAISQGGTLVHMFKPYVSSPKAFIRWLLVLENQGLRVFDHGTSMGCLRALMLESVETESPQCKFDIKNINPDILICNEAYGEKNQEINGLSKIGFSGKKRKDELRDWQETRMKHPKIDFFGSPAQNKFSPLSNGNGMHCGVEVNSASSDCEDEMET